MQTLETLDQFLYDLTWSDNVRHQLRVMADRDDVKLLVAWDNAGKMSAKAFTGEPDEWPDKVVAIWRKQTLRDAMKSKTQKAVDLVLKKDFTPHAAAKAMELNPSAVYRALQRAQNRTLCPCCGQVVREGFKIDRAVLKTPSAG